MNKKITRREFLQKGKKITLTTLALTACGELIPNILLAKTKSPEILVDDSKLITDIETLKKYETIPFLYNDKKSILVYNNGEIRAFENICTHKKGPTQLRGNNLVCKWHGAKFDPLTGKALTKPAPKGSQLKAIEIVIKEGKINVA